MKIQLVVLMILSTLSLAAQNKQYKYTVDILNIKNDTVNVSLTPPKNNLASGKFTIPKIVPGIYQAMNFGQYIFDLKATDSRGKELIVSRLDTNSWQIHNLKYAVKISYKVNSGWKYLSQNTGGPKSPGSIFRKDSISIINYNSLLGYFEEIRNAGYEITVIKNKGFYASSALTYVRKNDTTDQVRAVDYRRLVDAPVMYCMPDTTWLNIGATDVLVSFYGNQGKRYSKAIATTLKPVMENQMAYMGGKLPVNKYAFLVYFENTDNNSSMVDGLEHSSSTLCLYGGSSIEEMNPALLTIASHEFFHILTPLNIHSNEIKNFDFLNPVMSQHLWLYEGMTEYATMHMPVKQGMIDLKSFLATISSKAKEAHKFDNSLSLTTASKLALTRQDQYRNFYLKGALAGMCLDIRLRELSGGKLGTQELMQKLSNKYGPERAFKDEELFEVIISSTFPAVRQFFNDHVNGNKPLPVKEALNKVGLDYDVREHKISVQPSPTGEQLLLRKAWINQ